MSVQSSISGLNTIEYKLDAIGNNIANAATVGFRESIASFSAVYGAKNSSGQSGVGVTTAAMSRRLDQGSLRETRNTLDVAIVGKGLFQVQRDDGTLAYTRNGQFHRDADGYVVTTNGSKLMATSGPLKIDPFVWSNIKISDNGQITGTDGTRFPAEVESPPGIGYTVPGPLLFKDIASINLFDFRNQQGLEPVGNSLFVETVSSGAATSYAPGTEHMGLMRSGSVEQSNVSLEDNLVNMIIAQREYQGNSQALKTLIEMEQRLLKA